MREGYWINYATGAVHEIDEHEYWLRRNGNARLLGLPEAVVARFGDYLPERDRNVFLEYILRSAPVMRVRGHGESVTFEFNAPDWERPLAAVRAWGAGNAGPLLRMSLFNFARSERREWLWRDMPGNLTDL